MRCSNPPRGLFLGRRGEVVGPSAATGREAHASAPAATVARPPNNSRAKGRASTHEDTKAGSVKSCARRRPTLPSATVVAIESSAAVSSPPPIVCCKVRPTKMSKRCRAPSSTSWPVARRRCVTLHTSSHRRSKAISVRASSRTHGASCKSATLAVTALNWPEGCPASQSRPPTCGPNGGHQTPCTCAARTPSPKRRPLAARARERRSCWPTTPRCARAAANALSSSRRTTSIVVRAERLPVVDVPHVEEHTALSARKLAAADAIVDRAEAEQHSRAHLPNTDGARHMLVGRRGGRLCTNSLGPGAHEEPPRGGFAAGSFCCCLSCPRGSAVRQVRDLCRLSVTLVPPME